MPDTDITRLIAAWLRGDKNAENALYEHLYRDLHRNALHMLHRDPIRQTISPTTLVHEAYLKLENAAALNVGDREHFLRLAAQVMHRILVDRARARLSAKRGGDLVRVEDAEQLVATDAAADEILQVDQALEQLRKQSARQAQVVELRYFAGYTLQEIAGLLGVAERTVKRDWDVARTRLQIALSTEIAGNSPIA